MIKKLTKPFTGGKKKQKKGKIPAAGFHPIHIPDLEVDHNDPRYQHPEKQQAHAQASSAANYNNDANYQEQAAQKQKKPKSKTFSTSKKSDE